MRVVYFSYLHPAVVPGGAQQVAYDLFRASLEAGHDAYLVAALEESHEAEYGKPGAPIVPIPGYERQYFFFPQFFDHFWLSSGDPRSMGFLRTFLEGLRPDVIHFHHYHRVGVEAMRIARLAAPAAVVALTFHEMMAMCHADGQMVTTKARALCPEATPLACHQCFPGVPAEAFALRARRMQVLLSACDAFVFPSLFLAERYVDWGLPEERCMVIANGQPALACGFDRGGHSEALNRFGFFGQFIDNKGIDVLFEALIVLAQQNRVPPAGLVVEINGGNKQFASPAYHRRVGELSEALRAISNGRIGVVERGAYRHDDLPGRMRSVDWVVVPSTWWEVFGLVVSEARQFGRPVIASDIGGLGQRIEDGVTGFKVPARDPGRLAGVIAGLVGRHDRWSAVNAATARTWSDADMVEAYVATWEESRPRASPDAA